MKNKPSNGCERDVLLAGSLIVRKNANGDYDTLLLWKRNHGHWELPGGKVENSETPFNAAIREAVEEASVEIKVVKTLIADERFKIDGVCFNSFIFLSKIVSGTPAVGEPDTFREVKYIKIDSKFENLAENVRQIFEKIESGEIKLDMENNN